MTVWILVGKTENNSSLLDLLVFAKLSFQSLSRPLQALINSMLEQSFQDGALAAELSLPLKHYLNLFMFPRLMAPVAQISVIAYSL